MQQRYIHESYNCLEVFCIILVYFDNALDSTFIYSCVLAEVSMHVLLWLASVCRFSSPWMPQSLECVWKTRVLSNLVL